MINPLDALLTPEEQKNFFRAVIFIIGYYAVYLKTRLTKVEKKVDITLSQIQGVINELCSEPDCPFKNFKTGKERRHAEAKTLLPKMRRSSISQVGLQPSDSGRKDEQSSPL